MTKVEKALRRSPINYFSDLFVGAMVVVWLFAIIFEIVFAAYGTIRLGDMSGWSYVDNTATIPVASGGAIWMIKNSVQHAIANNKGQQANMDFPPVPDTEIAHETAAEDIGAEAEG